MILALLNVSDGFKYEFGRFLFGLTVLACIFVGIVLASLVHAWASNRKDKKDRHG